MSATRCKWCNKKIGNGDERAFIQERSGKYVTSISGTDGPYHRGCAVAKAERRNAAAQYVSQIRNARK